MPRIFLIQSGKSWRTRLTLDEELIALLKKVVRSEPIKTSLVSLIAKSNEALEKSENGEPTGEQEGAGVLAPGACLAEKARQSYHLMVSKGRVPVDPPRLHGMAPSQGLGVGQITSDSRNETRLDQGAELEVDGVHVGVTAGEMAEAAVAVAASKRPSRRPC